jgi:hypothetical protein
VINGPFPRQQVTAVHTAHLPLKPILLFPRIEVHTWQPQQNLPLPHSCLQPPCPHGCFQGRTSSSISEMRTGEPKPIADGLTLSQLTIAGHRSCDGGGLPLLQRKNPAPLPFSTPCRRFLHCCLYVASVAMMIPRFRISSQPRPAPL